MIDDTLKCWGDCFVGKVGFSFTQKSLFSTAQALFKHCNKNFISKICIAHDSRQHSESFSHELVNFLSDMGVATVIVDGASPIFLLSWLSTQKDSDTRTMGVYIGGDQAPSNMLSISFRDGEGSPFSESQTKELHKLYLHNMLFPWEHRDRRRDPEYVDLKEGYARWLVDTLNLKTLTSSYVVGVDYLTSPVKPYLQHLFSHLNIGISPIPEEFWHTPLVTGQLRPCPLGWPLSYPQDKFPRNIQLHVSFDGDGDCIGIYDNVTKEALSSSATFAILLYYLTKIKKKKGTVLISRAVSDKVASIAISYGLAVEYVDGGLSGLSAKLKEKRKRPILIYGDEEGGFWFKGMPLDRNPFPAVLYVIESCLATGLSPAQLYDKIADKELDRSYYFGKIDIKPRHVDPKRLLDLLYSDSNVGARGITQRDVVKSIGQEKENVPVTLRLSDDSKITIQPNLKNDFIELYVETTESEALHEVMGDVQSRIFYDTLP